jgi:thiamine biosynthesis protein ThiI
MDKDEITEEAIRLGSYPISIIPDQDCCTLFTPRNPMTRARLGAIEAAEATLPVDEIVERAVNEAVVEDHEFPVVGSKRRKVAPLEGEASADRQVEPDGVPGS